MTLIPSVTDDGVKWRRFYYFCTAPAAITWLTAIFLFPDTYFKRPAIAYNGHTILQSASEKVTIYEDGGLDLDWPLFNKDLPVAPSRNRLQRIFDYCCIRVTRASWKSMLLCYPQVLFCLINPLIFWVFVMTAIRYSLDYTDKISSANVFAVSAPCLFDLLFPYDGQREGLL